MAQTVVQIDTGRFTNAFALRGESGCILVDTGNPRAENRILEQMAEHSISTGDIHLILITHGHTDHFGSAAVLRERIGAPVAVHVSDADALRQGIHQPGSLKPTGWLLAFLMRLPFLRDLAVSNQAPVLEPDLLLEGEQRLDEYGIAGRVIPTPGHTPGSVSVLLDEGAAVVGDMVMGRLMGLLRQPGPPIVAQDLEQNWRSMARFLALSPRTIYVGHGGPFNAEETTELLANQLKEKRE